MAKHYFIELEDQGQDLLRLKVDAETGIIKDCGPFHKGLYANCGVQVDVGELQKSRIVRRRRDGGAWHTFKWPMVKLRLGNRILAKA